MLMTNTVMCAKQPGLKVREGNMDHWQVRIGFLTITIKHHRIVRVTQDTQLIVTLPAIGAYHGTLRDILLHEFRESISTAIWYKAQSQSACVNGSLGLAAISANRSWADFDSSGDRSFMVDTTPLALCASTNKCLIYFDGELGPNSITLRSHHAGAEFVENLKRCLVAPQPKLPLKLHRRLARRLCRHKVRAPEPRRQRRVTALHDCTSHERIISLAGTATQDDRASLVESVRLTNVSALHTRKPMWPPQVFKVSCASHVIGKHPLKFWKRRRKAACIHAGNLALDHLFGNQPDRQGINQRPVEGAPRVLRRFPPRAAMGVDQGHGNLPIKVCMAASIAA